MARVARQYIGARGLDKRSNLFSTNELRTIEAENFRVTGNSRRQSPGFIRWLYDKYCSNALRFHGNRKKSWMVANDSNNLSYNCNTSAMTVEAKIRLAKNSGLSLQTPIVLFQRIVYLAGVKKHTFRVALVGVSATDPFEDYKIEFSLHNAAGTLTTVSSVLAIVSAGDWAHLAIKRSGDNVTFYLNGQNVETINTPSLAAAIQATFGTTQTGLYHGDIEFASNDDNTLFYNFDIDEFRLWADGRTDQEITDYYNTDLPDSQVADANLLSYINFEEIDNTQYLCADKKRSKNPIFLGGTLPYFDEEDETLVFPATRHLGRITSSLLDGAPSGLLFDLNENFSSEFAFIPLKAKQGYALFIGTNSYLALTFDGTDKYRISFTFDKAGAPITIQATTGFIDQNQFDTTCKVYVGVRNDVANTLIELWVNGILTASHNYGVSALGDAQANLISGQTGLLNRLPIKLIWARVHRDLLPASHFEDHYNEDIPDYYTNTYNGGTVNIDHFDSTQAEVTGQETLFNDRLAAMVFGYHYDLRLTGGTNELSYPGFNLIQKINNLVKATQKFKISLPPELKSVATDPLVYKGGYQIARTAWSYDQSSFRNQRLNSVRDNVYYPNSSFAGYVDATDQNVDYQLVIEDINVVIIRENEGPSYISGNTRLEHLKPVRFIGEIREVDQLVDSIVVIVGTALITINKATKERTYWDVGILPNGNKLFSAASFERQLYLTDGKTFIHIYVFNRKIRVRRWGFPKVSETNIPFGPASGIPSGTGTWTAKLGYKLCYYNRELDQYGETSATSDHQLATESNLLNFASKKYVKLDIFNYASELDPSYGATDIVILRTKNINTIDGFEGEYYVLDAIDSRSEGYIDWTQGDAEISNLYPQERIGQPLNPPNGDVVIEHEGRLFVLGGDCSDCMYFNEVDARLHRDILRSETYCFPPSNVFRFPGNRQLTSAGSLGGILYVFTRESIHILQGSSPTDFQSRLLFEGVGCVSHHTLKNAGGFLIWLGADDIYVLSGGPPRPLDSEGRVRRFIRETLSPADLKRAFAVFNVEEQTYELTVYNKGVGVGQRKFTLVYDFISGEFTIDTDLLCSYGAILIDIDEKARAFYGHEKGFIVAQDTLPYMYQPSTGSLRSTVTSFNLATLQVTTADTDLHTAEAGLIGNIAYIISQDPDTFGYIIKGVIGKNTNSTFTLEAGHVIVGIPFLIQNNDIIIIGAPMMRLKTGLIGVVNNPRLERDSEEVISDAVAQEVLDISLIKEPAASTSEAFVQLFLDGALVGRLPRKFPDMDKAYSKVGFKSHTRCQYYQAEIYFLHESSFFDLAGFIVGVNITRGTHK